MIDPKDVRVGNWVLRITGIDLNTKSFFEYKPIALDEYLYTFAKECYPILLSPAILEQCNFSQRQDGWFINLSGESIDEGPAFLSFQKTEQSWYFRDQKIPARLKYVHQLQNIYYSLSNMELIVNLELFKNIDIVSPVNFFVKIIDPKKTYRSLL